MPKSTAAAEGVSPHNPCPFLRALVANGKLPDDQAPIAQVAKAVVEVARAGDGKPELPVAAIWAIALMANGLGPLQLGRNALGGLRLDALRGGPLDKKGVGSAILDEHAKVNEEELARLDSFASDQLDAKGRIERGLGASDLKRMMDANFERAQGRRRPIDRRLMDGEWPILLKVMGKQGKSGRYLSVAEVRDLFIKQRFPSRMLKKLGRE